MAKICKNAGKHGAPEEIRTPDPQIRSLTCPADIAQKKRKPRHFTSQVNQWVKDPFANHFKPVQGAVYVGRERIGKLVQVDKKKFRAFGAGDNPLGNFRIRERALKAIRKASGLRV